MEALQLQLSVLKDQKEKIENVKEHLFLFRHVHSMQELRGDVQRLSQKVESLEKNLAEAEREREFADSQLRECQQRLRQAYVGPSLDDCTVLGYASLYLSVFSMVLLIPSNGLNSIF